MTTTKPRKRQRKAPLIVMQPPLVARRNVARKLVLELSRNADDILERLQNGVRVEPGIHTAEIEVRIDRGRYTEVLLIDGHELVLPEFPRVSS